MPSPSDWIRSGTGLPPRVTWAFATDAELISVSLAAESSEVFAVDKAGGVYRLSRAGRIEGLSRGLHEPRLICWAHTGDVGFVVEGSDQISLLDSSLNVAWSAGAPSSIFSAAIDAYGHNIAMALQSSDTVIINADRQKLAQFSTTRPLHYLEFSVGIPKLIGAADHGLLCCHSLDGEEEWSERLYSNCGCVSVTGDAKRILVAEYSHGLQVFDSRGQSQASFVLDGTPSIVSASHFGERAAVATVEQQIYWLDADGTLMWATECPEEILSLHCDPLGEWLIVALKSGRILRLDWDTA